MRTAAGGRSGHRHPRCGHRSHGSASRACTRNEELPAIRRWDSRRRVSQVFLHACVVVEIRIAMPMLKADANKTVSIVGSNRTVRMPLTNFRMIKSS
jgi:hypothetical protein